MLIASDGFGAPPTGIVVCQDSACRLQIRRISIQSFTIRTVPALLAKTTARQDYCDRRRSLEQALKRLAKSMKQAA
ncbi:hypothetical protein ASB65_16800 [Agrobacterium tumefaciens str. B6]|jgi:hypothetical protein|nr:hypothetical protein ASB65_16800 [Agrobacterium tumefaciens str. B6]OCJ39448.1 hypothetical protein A6U90_19160 [Agrobacterium tumefaciens]